MKQEMTGWQWHQLDHMQIICTSLQTDNHASTSSLNFYMPNALPDAQPTVSNHWRPRYINCMYLRQQRSLSHVAGSRFRAGKDCLHTGGEDARNARCGTREFSPDLQRRRSFYRAAAPAVRDGSSRERNCQWRTEENGCNPLPCPQAPALSAPGSYTTSQISISHATEVSNLTSA